MSIREILLLGLIGFITVETLGVIRPRGLAELALVGLLILLLLVGLIGDICFEINFALGFEFSLMLL